MVGVIKALLGVVSAGAGVAVPIAVNKLGNIVPTEVKSSFKNSFDNAERQVTSNRRNLKVQRTLKDLQNKNCKQVKNTENNNVVFSSLYACRGVNDQANFYYLGEENSFDFSNESFLAKKVLVVNYEKGENNQADQLSLRLDDQKEVKWKIASQGDGGWSHFRNVDTSKQCKIARYGSGEEVISCQLKNLDQTTFSYSFSIL